MQKVDDQARDANAEGEGSSEERLYAYARRWYMVHGFKALSLDQRIGPFIQADDLPAFEKRHGIADDLETHVAG
jgi:hypothetical protein